MYLVKTIAFSCLSLLRQSCLSNDRVVSLEPQPRSRTEITRNWHRFQTSLSQEENAHERQSRAVSITPDTPLLECTPPNGTSLHHTGYLNYRKDYITYSIAATSRTISEEDIGRAMEEAMAAWSSVTPLIFVEDDEDADIKVSFGRPNGCKHTTPILACTVPYYHGPSRSTRSIVRFNDSIDWYYAARDEVKRDQAFNLVCTATHEIGHALGLTHSCTDGATMFPLLPETGQCDLGSEDEDRIQNVYGTPTSTHLYFHNVEKASYMTTPDPNCEDCSDVEMGKSEYAQWWEVFDATNEDVQIRSTTNRSRCVEANGKGQVTLEECQVGDEAQLWHQGYNVPGNNEVTSFKNIATQQFLYADCNNDTVCTKASDAPDVEQIYELWKLSKALEPVAEKEVEKGEEGEGDEGKETQS